MCDFIVSFWGSRVFVWFFGSFPQVILSLAEFTNALERDVKERLPKTLTRFVFHRILRCVSCRMQDDDPTEITRTEEVDAIVARGRILWDSIYEPHAVKLHDKLSSYHPDFMGEYMCTHIAAFFVPLPPLSIFLSLVCSLRPTTTPHSPCPTPTPAPRFTLGFPRMNRRDGRNPIFASFELYSSSIASPKEVVGNKQKAFFFFFARDCAYLLATRHFGTASGSIPFPAPAPAPVPRCYEVEWREHKGVTIRWSPQIQSRCVSSSLFPRFPITSPLFTPNARPLLPTFPHLHLYSSIYRYTVPRYTVLPVWTEMPLYRYLSIKITFLAPAHLPFTDLRSVCFR